MARIAVISDVHGNVPALEAVLDDLTGQEVDEVLVGGDMVGRGPEGSRVVKRIRELGFPAIGGNHEDYLLTFRRGEIPDHWHEAEEWAASRWMAAELDDGDAAYLEVLPFDLVRPGLRLVHGTPRSNREGIGPWTRGDEIAGFFAAIPEGLLACAHTHRPLVHELDGGGLVVNVGAVGMPFNGDRRAQYAIFTGGAGGFEVELRRVDYDLDRIFAIYDDSGFLAEGGVTARLLRLELEHAAPLLVPFLEWARATGVEATAAQLEPFFRAFRPGGSLRAFFRSLRR